DVMANIVIGWSGLRGRIVGIEHGYRSSAALVSVIVTVARQSITCLELKMIDHPLPQGECECVVAGVCHGFVDHKWADCWVRPYCWEDRHAGGIITRREQIAIGKPLQSPAGVMLVFR